MDVVEVINRRKAIRAFRPDPVSKDLLRQIIEQALRAPSWANTQPWEFAIATGSKLRQIQEGFMAKREEKPYPDVARPQEYPEPYETRRSGAAAGQTKERVEARKLENLRNYGAPAVIYLLVGRSFFFQPKGINVWPLYDCGSVVQNIMLLATNNGLGTIAQAQAVIYPDVIRKVLGIPESKLIALGIAIGYPNWDDPENQPRRPREPVDRVAQWYGFD
jgi:nitroreductase